MLGGGEANNQNSGEAKATEPRFQSSCYVITGKGITIYLLIAIHMNRRDAVFDNNGIGGLYSQFAVATAHEIVRDSLAWKERVRLRYLGRAEA